MRFGNYEVEASPEGAPVILGKGGFGTTYKARHRLLKRVCALKIINDTKLKDSAIRARFLQEAQSAATLHHANIAAIFDFGEEDGVMYYTMEFCDGGTLEEDLARNGKLTWEQALPLIRQLAHALEYAHGNGMLHRDIKPANIMFREAGSRKTLKLIDFGLAKSVLPDSPDDTHLGLTQDGQFLGNPLTASPEQFLEVELDQRTDMFSLGVTIWCMLVGGPPFGITKSAAIIADRLAEKSYAERLPETLTSQAKAILQGLLEKDRDNRTASAVQLLQQLDGLGKAANNAEPATPSVEKAPHHEPVPESAKEKDLLVDILEQREVLAAGTLYQCRDNSRGGLPMLLLLSETELQINWQALRDLRHPLIPALIDHGELDGAHAVLFEDMPGFRLLDLLKNRGAQGIQAMSTVVESIAHACDAAVAAGLRGLELDAGLVRILVPGVDDPKELTDDWGRGEFLPSLFPLLEAPEGSQGHDVGTTINGSSDGPAHVMFAALVYRLVSGLPVKPKAYLTSHAYIPTSALSEQGNRLLATTISSERLDSTCQEFLTTLLQMEGTAVPGWDKTRLADLRLNFTTVALKKHKEEASRAVVEAEKRKKEAEESEKLKKAAEEAERLRRAADEAETVRRAAEEAERLKKAAVEAESLRKAAAEAEKLKKAADEAEKLRKAAEEAEKLRKAAEEAERLRKAAEEAARKAQELQAARDKQKEAERLAAAAEKQREAERRAAEKERAKKEQAEKELAKKEEARRRAAEKEEAKWRAAGSGASTSGGGHGPAGLFAGTTAKIIGAIAAIVVAFVGYRAVFGPGKPVEAPQENTSGAVHENMQDKKSATAEVPQPPPPQEFRYVAQVSSLPQPLPVGSAIKGVLKSGSGAAEEEMTRNAQGTFELHSTRRYDSCQVTCTIPGYEDYAQSLPLSAEQAVVNFQYTGRPWVEVGTKSPKFEGLSYVLSIQGREIPPQPGLGRQRHLLPVGTSFPCSVSLKVTGMTEGERKLENPGEMLLLEQVGSVPVIDFASIKVQLEGDDVDAASNTFPLNHKEFTVEFSESDGSTKSLELIPGTRSWRVWPSDEESYKLIVSSPGYLSQETTIPRSRDRFQKPSLITLVRQKLSFTLPAWEKSSVFNALRLTRVKGEMANGTPVPVPLGCRSEYATDFNLGNTAVNAQIVHNEQYKLVWLTLVDGNTQIGENVIGYLPAVKSIAVPPPPKIVIGSYEGKAVEDVRDAKGKSLGQRLNVDCKMEIQWGTRTKLVVKESYRYSYNGREITTNAYTMTPTKVSESSIIAEITSEDLEKMEAKLQKAMKDKMLVGRPITIPIQGDTIKTKTLYFEEEVTFRKR